MLGFQSPITLARYHSRAIVACEPNVEDVQSWSAVGRTETEEVAISGVFCDFLDAVFEIAFCSKWGILATTHYGNLTGNIFAHRLHSHHERSQKVSHSGALSTISEVVQQQCLRWRKSYAQYERITAPDLLDQSLRIQIPAAVVARLTDQQEDPPIVFGASLQEMDRVAYGVEDSRSAIARLQTFQAASDHIGVARESNKRFGFRIKCDESSLAVPISEKKIRQRSEPTELIKLEPRHPALLECNHYGNRLIVQIVVDMKSLGYSIVGQLEI